MAGTKRRTTYRADFCFAKSQVHITKLPIHTVGDVMSEDEGQVLCLKVVGRYAGWYKTNLWTNALSVPPLNLHSHILAKEGPGTLQPGKCAQKDERSVPARISVAGLKRFLMKPSLGRVVGA